MVSVQPAHEHGHHISLLLVQFLRLTAAALRVSALRHVRLALPGVFHGTERDPHPLHGPAAPAQQGVLHVVPEVLRHKVVDKRVQAAVEAGQAQSGDVEAVTVVDHAVLQ